MGFDKLKLNRRTMLATTGATIVFAGGGTALADQAAETYVAGVLAEANKFMAEDEATRLAGIKTMVDDHVDMRRVGRFVLGQYARRMTDAQAAVYHPLFEKYATLVYQNALSNYSGEQLEVTNSIDRSERDIIVNSRIINAKPGSAFADMTVHWRVYRDRDGNMSVFDAGADGIWLAIEQQSQFKSIIANNGGGEAGIDALIGQLREQVGG